MQCEKIENLSEPRDCQESLQYVWMKDLFLTKPREKLKINLSYFKKIGWRYTFFLIAFDLWINHTKLTKESD